MKINISFCISALLLGVFVYTAYKNKECRNYEYKANNLILSRAINLTSQCPVISFQCVNSAILFKLEQTELLNADLKEMGCK